MKTWREKTVLVLAGVAGSVLIYLSLMPTQGPPEMAPKNAYIGHTTIAAKTVPDMETVLWLIRTNRNDILAVSLVKKEIVSLVEATPVTVIKSANINGEPVDFISVDAGIYNGNLYYVMKSHIIRR